MYQEKNSSRNPYKCGENYDHGGPRRAANPRRVKHEEEHMEDTLAELDKTSNGEKDLQVARGGGKQLLYQRRGIHRSYQLC